MTLVPGKVALVTGAGAGIGRAAALKFAEEGATVVAADIGMEGCKETAALIREGGGEASFIEADVSKADDVRAMVAHVIATHGRLDCACNNAGVLGKLAPTGEQTEDDFDRVVTVNLRGSSFVCVPRSRKC